MNGISISLQEVSDAAAKISSLNQQIYDHLQDMKQQMNALDGTWVSDAGETIRTKFNTASNRFEEQKSVIDAYVRFLELTVSSYDSLETAIQTNASGMQE